MSFLTCLANRCYVILLASILSCQITVFSRASIIVVFSVKLPSPSGTSFARTYLKNYIQEVSMPPWFLSRSHSYKLFEVWKTSQIIKRISIALESLFEMIWPTKFPIIGEVSSKKYVRGSLSCSVSYSNLAKKACKIVKPEKIPLMS